MSRPRPIPDPHRWPTPCCRCGQHYRIAAHWPDGPICGYCYQASKRICGTCACGHEGVPPGCIDGEPACRTCSGVKLNVDCRNCGREDKIYADDQCWSCVLANTVDQLMSDPQTGAISPTLVPLADALKSMKRANSGLAWIRQDHVSGFMRRLAVAPEISHQAIDALPRSRTREFVRGLLVEHGALPQRDIYLANYVHWSQEALNRLTTQTGRLSTATSVGSTCGE